jgi:hypothetical protein
MKGIAPNGQEITGTFETITGRAGITFCDPGNSDAEQEGQLSFNWNGGTDIFWNEQKTVLNEADQRIFLDEDGNQWIEDQITLVPDCYGEIDSSDKCASCTHIDKCAEVNK